MTDDDLRLAQAFAEQCYTSNLKAYARRKQHDAEKIRQDIYLGKVAEFAVARHLLARGFELDLPDTKVYAATEKSYAPDLLVNGVGIHVKSFDHTSVTRSWVFQKADEPTGILGLCETQLPYVHVHALLPAELFVRDYLPPVFDRPSKKVLYAWVLREHGNRFDLSRLK